MATLRNRFLHSISKAWNNFFRNVKHYLRKIAESTHKGVNQRLKDVTPARQQRPELPMVMVVFVCLVFVHMPGELQ